MTREDYENLLWEKASEVLFVEKEDFLSDLAPWTIVPVEIGSELAVLTLQKGACFHFFSLGTRHPITRRMIFEFLRPIIAEFGYAETRTPKSDTRQHRFNRIFGFQPVGEDAFDVIYRITALPSE